MRWRDINVSVVAIVGSVSVGTLLYLQWRKKKEDKLSPLPPPGPSFAEFLSGCTKAENQKATRDKYGDCFSIPSPLPGIVPTQIWINDPAVVKYLTVTCANMYRPPSTFTTRNAAFQKATQSIVGVGVTGLVGEEWRWRKMALIKSFQKSSMMASQRGLVEKVVEEGKRLCETLGKAADNGETVAVDLLTTRAAVGVVLYFLFGRDLKFDAENLREAAGTLMECLGYSLFTPTFAIAKYFPGTQSYQMEQRKKQAWRDIDGVVKNEIQRLLDEYNGLQPIHPDRKPGSVMATLIGTEPRFRQGGVASMIAEARVFVQAGFETTAHSLAFSMGMMAERQDLAHQMAIMGKELLGNDFYNPVEVKQAMEKADFVKNFFLEAIRLYPLAPALGGECTENIVVTASNGATYGFPKGCGFFFPNLLLQRSLQLEQPDDIVPSRWGVPTKDAEPFLHTFQNGPHACPGKPLSLLEGQIFLLLVATQFEFSFPQGTTKVEFEDNLLLRPKDGMPLKVTRRH